MIVGNDISDFQGQLDWPTVKNNVNFIGMKATEGTGYIDTWFGYNREQARNLHIPRLFYAFGRPDLGNSPQTEADFFCRVIDGDPIQVGEVIALDFEVNYHDPVGWCLEWVKRVSEHFNGLKPLIYLNQSLASSYDWQPVIDFGCGLWLASYTYDPNDNTGNTGKWPFMAIQQWTDKQQVPGIQGNVDGDVFFGSEGQFMEYGYKLPVPIPQPTPVPPTPAPVPPPSVGSSSVSPSESPSASASASASQSSSASASPSDSAPDEPLPPEPPVPPSNPFQAFLKALGELLRSIFHF